MLARCEKVGGMSAPVLTTALNRDSDKAKARIAHNRALRPDEITK